MIYEDLSWIFLEWRRYQQRRLSPFGVTIQQYALMRTIERDGDMCAGTAADFLHCDKPTLSVIIANLIKKGWIIKVTSPEDKRMAILKLTEDGKSIIAEMASSFPKEVKKPFDTLSRDEYRELARLLRIGRAHLTEIINEEKQASE